MTTQVRAAEQPAPAPAPLGWTDHVRPLLVVAAVGMVVAAFFLLVYPAKRYPEPIGWDTPRYLLQTAIVGEHGLTGVPRQLPPPSKTLASRAAFPVIVLSLSSLFSASTFKLAQTVPIAAAMAIALAIAAFATAGLRRRTATLAFVALLVGISPWLIRLMAPETYTDNLFFLALVTASLAPMLFAVRDGRGYLAAVSLLAAAGLAHVQFFAAALLVMALLGVMYGPASWRAWRAGARPWATPSGRLAVIAGGAAAVAGIGLFGLLRRAPDSPKLSPGELSKKLRQDVPLYAYPATLPLAVLGAGSISHATGFPPGRTPDAGTDRFGARFLLLTFAAWTLVVVAGLVAFAAGKDLPAHRFLAMLIPIPVALAFGVLAIGAWLGSRTGHHRRAVAAACLIAVAGFGALGIKELYVDLPATRGIEWIEHHKIEETANAVAYLEWAHIPATAPVVFVIDDWGGNPLSNLPEVAYITRSALPADRVEHSWFYVGNPDRYLAGRPTLRSRPKTYDANSRAFWRPLAAMLAARSSPPVALLLEHTSPFFQAEQQRHPDWLVAPGVLALHGPRPARPLGAAVAPSGMRTVPQGLVLSLGTIALFAIIGAGWALALLPAGLRTFEILALSPAFGVGFLLFSGVLVDAVGIRLAGAGGTLTVLVALASGWLLAIARLRRHPLGSLFPAA